MCVHDGEEGWGEGFVACEPHTETITLSLEVWCGPLAAGLPLVYKEAFVIPLLVRGRTGG
jgi:hypothetical protein